MALCGLIRRVQISLPLIRSSDGRRPHGRDFGERTRRAVETCVRQPTVAVTIVEYRSQPVSVIGAVAQTGVHQLEGRKTLIEMLAKAGGLRPDAGNIIKITRRVEWGAIPLSRR